ATTDAIEELHDLQERGDLDRELRLDGWLWTASSRAQENAWDDSLKPCGDYGVSPYRPLSAAEIVARTSSDASYAGVIEPRAGPLHPGKLMRSLKKYAAAKGAVIYEHTPVTIMETGPTLTLETPHGTVTAG